MVVVPQSAAHGSGPRPAGTVMTGAVTTVTVVAVVRTPHFVTELSDSIRRAIRPGRMSDQQSSDRPNHPRAVWEVQAEFRRRSSDAGRAARRARLARLDSRDGAHRVDCGPGAGRRARARDRTGTAAAA